MTALFPEPVIRLAGERGLLAEYGDVIDPEVNRKVRAMFIALQQAAPSWLVEALPTYRSLLILYDPVQAEPHAIGAFLKGLESRLTETSIPPPKLHEIPVCYGGDLGPDLPFVAESHGLTPEEVIRIHSEPTYPIYMIGFTPGFPFLGGLPEALHTPRLKTPRTRVPAGSVAIANNQTGIYSITSPGGWQLIGRTPLRLFDPQRQNPFLVQAGDRLRFKPISREVYDFLREGGER